MKNKLYLDKRTGEIVKQFNILDIKYMLELEETELETCPNCDKQFVKRFGALSRKNNKTYICSNCGTMEGLASIRVSELAKKMGIPFKQF